VVLKVLILYFHPYPYLYLYLCRYLLKNLYRLFRLEVVDRLEVDNGFFDLGVSFALGLG
jgi:hypothetical protein